MIKIQQFTFSKSKAYTNINRPAYILVVIMLVMLCILCTQSRPAFSLTLQKKAEIKYFVKGSFTDIQKTYDGQPFIMVFWSEYCTYCLEELALLGKLQKEYPNMKLAVVSTDVFLEDKTVYQVLNNSKLNLKETWVFGEYFPEKIYADVEPGWRGELPLTYFFTAKGKKVKKMGITNEVVFRAWLKNISVQ